MDPAELLVAPLALPCGAMLPDRTAKVAMGERLGDRADHPTPRLERPHSRWGRGGAAPVADRIDAAVRRKEAR